MQREQWYRAGYLLIITGFAASLALHLASFWWPGLGEYGIWFALLYAVLLIFRNATSWRRSPFRRAPPDSAPAPGAETRRGVPPPGAPLSLAARVIALVQLGLWVYSIAWVIQLCVAPSAEMSPALLRAWTALGLALFFRWGLEVATRLGWWGGAGLQPPSTRR
jgi:hypothetical protein